MLHTDTEQINVICYEQLWPLHGTSLTFGVEDKFPSSSVYDLLMKFQLYI